MPDSAPTGVILAGGRSARMGRPKALVEVAGIPLIVRVAAALQSICDELVVVTNDPDVPGCLDARVVADEDPYEGPVAGLIAGLAVVSTELCVVVGCDMPLLSEPLLGRMVELARGGEVDAVAVPCAQGRAHPLHTVYRRACLPAIRRRFQRGERRAVAVLGGLQALCLEEAEWERFDPQRRSCWSVDTPEDVAVATALLVDC